MGREEIIILGGSHEDVGLGLLADAVESEACVVLEVFFRGGGRGIPTVRMKVRTGPWRRPLHVKLINLPLPELLLIAATCMYSLYSAELHALYLCYLF